MLCHFDAIRSFCSRFPWRTRNTNFWHAILFSLNPSAISNTLVIDDFPSPLGGFLLLRLLLERFRQINSSSSSINNLLYAIVIVIAVFVVYVRIRGRLNVHACVCVCYSGFCMCVVVFPEQQKKRVNPKGKMY